ncbi:Uncharacterised protein [Brucella melitensis]|nr:Uncharacterised protein [Brucella melitensis]
MIARLYLAENGGGNGGHAGGGGAGVFRAFQRTHALSNMSVVGLA